MHLTRARVRTALRKGTVLGWVVLPLLCSAPALAQGQDQRLIEAVKAADVNAVRALLEQRADASVTEADGSSALHWAVQNDDVETAELLIRAAPTSTRPIGTASGRSKPRARTAARAWSACW